jgi:hypothetical protein
MEWGRWDVKLELWVPTLDASLRRRLSHAESARTSPKLRPVATQRVGSVKKVTEEFTRSAASPGSRSSPEH